MPDSIDDLQQSERDEFKSRYPDIADNSGFVREDSDALDLINDHLAVDYTTQGAPVPGYVIEIIKLIRKTL